MNSTAVGTLIRTT